MMYEQEAEMLLETTKTLGKAFQLNKDLVTTLVDIVKKQDACIRALALEKAQNNENTCANTIGYLEHIMNLSMDGIHYECLNIRMSRDALWSWTPELLDLLQEFIDKKRKELVPGEN